MARNERSIKMKIIELFNQLAFPHAPPKLLSHKLASFKRVQGVVVIALVYDWDQKRIKWSLSLLKPNQGNLLMAMQLIKA